MIAMSDSTITSHL